VALPVPGLETVIDISTSPPIRTGSGSDVSIASEGRVASERTEASER